MPDSNKIYTGEGRMIEGGEARSKRKSIKPLYSDKELDELHRDKGTQDYKRELRRKR